MNNRPLILSRGKVLGGSGSINALVWATISRWLKLYREGGLSKLLKVRKSPGRPKTIPLEVLLLIKKELSQPEGFQSYEEILS